MNRRERAESDYRQKFEEIGLAERFDFIGRDWSSDHGRKVFVRCKTCNAEFVTYGVVMVFKGRQEHLLCPECGAASDGGSIWSRSKLCEEALQYYADGHSVAETAECFGVQKSQINSAAKRRGISNGRDFRQAANEYNKERNVKALRKRETLKQEREAKRAQRAHERQRAIAEERCRRKEEHEHEKQRAEAEKAEALFHLLNDKIHVCSVCEKNFSKAEFMASKGRTLIPTAPKYCSKKCERKAANKARKKSPSGKTGNYYDRARKYGCEYEPGITLKKLIRRNGLRCAICGEMCDPNDHSWTRFSGPQYPSIDHIIPLSKGGGHIWDNVQVAHIICNSEKGA